MIIVCLCLECATNCLQCSTAGSCDDNMCKIGYKKVGSVCQGKYLDSAVTSWSNFNLFINYIF